MSKTRCYILSAVGTAVMIALDQLLKVWSIAHLRNQPSRILINGFIQLTYLENTGAAFGLLAGFGGAQWLLSGYKLVILVLALVYFAKLPYEPRFIFLRVPLLMIIAGGIGNLIDRVRFGFVVDMLEFMFIRFAVFNLADVFIVTGIFLFAFAAIFVVKDAPLFGTPKKEIAE